MTVETDTFLITKDNGEVSDSTLWEAFKVVIRGHIISFKSSKRKGADCLMDIEKMLPVLEEAYRSFLFRF